MPPNKSPTCIIEPQDVSLLEDMSKRKRTLENDFDGVVPKRSASTEVEVTASNALQRIDCVVQKYAWGRVGSESLAGRLKQAQASDDDFELDEFTPFAEFWVGTHPNGMSEVRGKDGNKESLLDYVNKDAKLHLGNEKENDITFLLKVLSINKALSIQAHPDKKLAEQLHASRPNVYKDPNHKPEMAIAVTDDVEGMCGFLTLSQIACNLIEYPELAVIIGEENAKKVMTINTFTDERSVYSNLFRAYMEAPETVLRPQLNSMLKRIRSIPKSELNSTQVLILKLAVQYPGDCGIFAPLLLNHLKLKKGEGFFIGANEPHAYIYGELVECMACSDNVVRAGLTPKLKDVNTLVCMCTYKDSKPTITTGEKLDECTTLYIPPVKDFALEFIDVPAGESYVMGNVASPSVLLTITGSATLTQGDVQKVEAGFGSTQFVSANTKATIVGGKDGVRIIRGMSNVYFK